MTRATLTLVKPSPRPGPRALEFVRWAIDTYCEAHTSPGQVIVGRSQAALVAAHPTIDSHGTVSWYLRQLRDAGVVVGVRPITIDLDALGQFTGRPTPALAAAPDHAAGAEPAPEPHHRPVAELLAQRAERQARLAQLQAEIALTDAAIARALIDVDRPPGPATVTPELANDDSRDSRLSAGFANDRPAELANQEGRKVDLDNPPSFLNTKVANRDREAREHSRVDDGPTAPAEPLDFGTVDELVEPLRAWCRTNGRIDHLDNTGRRTLAALGHDQLAAGVATILREAAADPTIRRPVGLLIDRARKGHTDTFRPPTPPPARPPTEPTFETRDSRLTTDVLELAASPAGLAAARNTLGTSTTTTPRQETDPR